MARIVSKAYEDGNLREMRERKKDLA